MKTDLSKIKFIDATLQEFSFAMMSAESESIKEATIADFFGSYNRTTVITEPLSEYEHRKVQFVWEDYFKTNGWTIKKEIAFGYMTQVPAQKTNIEISPGVFKKIYRDSVIFYAKGEDKICVEITRAPRGEHCYYFHASEENSNIYEDIKKLASERNIYKNQRIDCRGNFLKLDNVEWEDIVLPEKVKEVIKSNIDEMFRLREQFKKHGLSVKRGVILYGPPGTGKTKVCKCLAKEAMYSVLYTMPSDFTSPNGIRNVCEMAQDLAPCLLIIEDIDWIAQDRSKGNAAFVMELMNKLDGLESFGDIITLGTTNALGELENAIKNRPGRFDRLINIDLPNPECREQMLKRFTKNFVIDDSVAFDKIAAATEGLTGAHINDLCNTAAIIAVKDSSLVGEKLLLKKSHF